MKKSRFVLGSVVVFAVIAGVAWKSTGPTDSSDVEGHYVEARSATVFAGACHVNAEADHQGRRALLGFHIVEGYWAGEDLSGVEIAVAVESNVNLSDGMPRRSILFVDESMTNRQRRAALGWLKEHYGQSLGESEEVVVAPVEVRREGEQFSLEVEGILVVEGASLPDLECCSMPESLWYEPLLTTEDALVGSAARCRFSGAGSLTAWTYEEQNNAFVGRIEEPVLESRDGNVAAQSCCDTPARVAHAVQQGKS